MSRPSGDKVQAEIVGYWINVSVGFGVTDPKTVRGLLGRADNETRDLIMRDGALLKKPVHYDDFKAYGESWRVAPKDSLLCENGQASPGMPPKPIYAEDLDPRERERVYGICVRAGVKPGPLLDDCMLDVSLLRDDSAANVFVCAPIPIDVIRPLP